MTDAARLLDGGVSDLWAACQRGYALDPILTVTEWADRYRWLSGKAASEPGKWHTSRTPYLAKIMDALSATSSFELVVFAKGSQIGGSECGINWIGYTVDQVPAPMMIVCPTVDLAKRFSKGRLDPLIEDTPCLRGKVNDPRSRDSGNTILLKEYSQGAMVLTGANSGVGLRSMPARYLDLEEVDAFPPSADEEGDPVILAQRALRTFGRRKKVFMNSTPKLTESSRIERELEKCDQKWLYHVPCPECGAHQELVWEQVKWPEGKPREAYYECAACQAAIQNHQKTWMLAHGQWVAEWSRGERSIGFHLSALYSPVGWFSWEECAEMFVNAKGNSELMRIFRNTVLGLSYQESHEAPDWNRLYERRESYRMGEVPPGALFLTAGVDVQKGRLEYEIVGWGRGKESWSVDYRVIDGEIAGQDVWRQLDHVLARDYPCAGGGSLPIRVLAVDSGHDSQHVYTFGRRHPQPAWGAAGASARHPRTVAVVKGEERGWQIVRSASGSGKKRGQLRLFLVSTWQGTSELYGFLRLNAPTGEERARGVQYPPGYCHFPEYPDEYFKQLTAEHVVVVYKKGFKTETFELANGLRNEALDCRKYARAAAELFGMSRFSEKQWAQIARERGIVAPEAEGPRDDPPPPAPPPVPLSNPTQRPTPPQTFGGRRSRFRMGG